MRTAQVLEKYTFGVKNAELPMIDYIETKTDNIDHEYLALHYKPL